MEVRHQAGHDLQRDILALRPYSDFCAAAGEPNIMANCLTGYQTGTKTFKVHLDSYHLVPFFSESANESPRRDLLHWNHGDGELVAVRVRNWKVVFKSQDHTGIGTCRQPLTNLRAPLLFNLRADPFERGVESNGIGEMALRTLLCYRAIARW